jgi:hypothetical protein
MGRVIPAGRIPGRVGLRYADLAQGSVAGLVLQSDELHIRSHTLLL